MVNWRTARRTLYPLAKWSCLLAAGLGAVVYPTPTDPDCYPRCIAADGKPLREEPIGQASLDSLGSPWLIRGTTTVDLAGARLHPFPNGRGGSGSSGDDSPSDPEGPTGPAIGSGTPPGPGPDIGGSSGEGGWFPSGFGPGYSGYVFASTNGHGNPAGEFGGLGPVIGFLGGGPGEIARSTSFNGAPGPHGNPPENFPPGDSDPGPHGPGHIGGLPDPYTDVPPYDGDPPGLDPHAPPILPDGAVDPTLPSGDPPHGAAVGEPLTLTLFGVALLTLGLTRFRRR